MKKITLLLRTAMSFLVLLVSLNINILRSIETPLGLDEGMDTRIANAAMNLQSAPQCLPGSGRGDECVPYTTTLFCAPPLSYAECPSYIFAANISGTLASRKPAKPNPSEEWFLADSSSAAFDQ
jgi:hypothetical protein